MNYQTFGSTMEKLRNITFWEVITAINQICAAVEGFL